MKRLFHCLILFAIFCIPAYAQEFEIKKYDLDVNVMPELYKVDVKARLQLVNLSGPELADKILLASIGDKPKLGFYLNPKAKVESMMVNDAAVQFKSIEDARANLQRVVTDMTSTYAAARELNVELKYSLSGIDRTPGLHISRSESFLFPASFWVPVVHTPYAEHGADTAPFSIKINAPPSMKVVSSGIRKSENSFEQSSASLPYFMVGDYEIVSRGGTAYPVEVYYPKGAIDPAKAQAERTADEAERILRYYADYFQVAVTSPFRIVASQARQLSTATTDTLSQSREMSFSGVGAVSIDDNLLRRDALDLNTIELLAQAATRNWIDGQTLLRGKGTNLIRDGLSVYLAAQYLGARYGDIQQAEAFDRYRRAYASIARSDAPLLTQSPLDRNYVTSVYNKGALVWRLLEKQLGKPIFDRGLRSSLTRSRTDVLSLEDWRAPLCQVSRCRNLKADFIGAGANTSTVDELFTNWIDQIILPDIAIGQPQITDGGVESTIANFGSGDLTVTVIATTDSGQKLQQNIAIKTGEYSAVKFPAGTNIKLIETDPERLFLQSDYSNDTFPRKPSDDVSYGKANLAFSKKDFATAESAARDALKANPDSPTLLTLLGRSLLGQNKNDEANKIFATVITSEPLPIQAYGWAQMGLGDIAMQRNDYAVADKHFRFASAADIDAATTIAARDGAVKAERASNTIKIPDDIRIFLQRFDAAVLVSTADAVNPFIEQGNLKRFSQMLVVRKPSVWITETLRSEQWDNDRTAVDVTLKLKIEGKDYAGRAVYVISKAGGKLLLSEVPVFDVK